MPKKTEPTPKKAAKSTAEIKPSLKKEAKTAAKKSPATLKKSPGTPKKTPKTSKAILPPQEATPTNSKRFDNILKATRQLIAGRAYSPMTRKELMQKLSLPAVHKELFNDIMRQLVKEKFVSYKLGRYAYAEETNEIVSGVIHMNARGFGFVTADAEFGYTADVFIPKHLTMSAIDGDSVEVLINGDALSDKGPEGKVTTILARSRTHVAGVITAITHSGEIHAYAPLLGLSQNILVENPKHMDIREGERVVMEVVEWGSRVQTTICRVSHSLGHIDDPSCDIDVAIEEFELRRDFPQKVMRQAQEYGTRVSQQDMAGREDLRAIETFTIDPTTAKDFDDALSLRKDKKGHYHLIVHIADVSHYVKENSPLDKEAMERCNSTYFPGFCLPMLPPTLSENLCSLKEKVNRLTVSVFMEFDPDGELIDSRIARTVINSDKRLTYEQAKEILDGRKKSKYAPTLHLMVELCHLLKSKRQARGSIEFFLPDLMILIDKEGSPIGTKSISYDITHQLVEEFMLKANELVAKYLTENQKGVAYRIHDEPNKENMRDFAQLVTSFGFTLSDDPSPQELQQFFLECNDTPYAQYLAINYIKRMKQAQYSAQNIGHYGLSLTHYCHFTSPIRRYIDLLIHRSLFSTSIDLQKVDKIAQACTEQERISAKAENSVMLLKKLRLLQKQKEQTPYLQYNAVITRVKNFGFNFELLDLLLEGFVHVAELSEDYFLFDEKSHRLEGRHTGKIYTSGDRITVMPKEIDLILLETKWQLIPEARLKEVRPKKTKASPRKERKRK